MLSHRHLTRAARLMNQVPGLYKRSKAARTIKAIKKRKKEERVPKIRRKS